MSSLPHIPHDQLDQENRHGVCGDAKRAAVPAKRPLSNGAGAGPKRARVPLGGKDRNLQGSLQRAKSYVPPSVLVALPLAAVVAPQPLLPRSKSTLTFFPHPSANVRPVPPVARDTNPHANDLFPAHLALRARDLVPPFSTDNIKKHALPPLPPTLLFAATVSAQTNRLHASHLSVPLCAQHHDPSKKTVSVDVLAEALADDENSVEFAPSRDLPPLEEGIDGYSPLSESELHVLRFGNRQSSPKPNPASDSPHDSSFHDDARYKLFQDDMERSGPIGLSQQELEDLIQF